MIRLSKSPLGRLAASVAVLGMVVPLTAAGPQGDDDDRRHGRGGPDRGHQRDRDGFSWRIVIGGPSQRDEPRRDRDFGRPQHRVPTDEVPCELKLQAFQAGDQVILIATGENHSRGYTTCLKACDLDGRTPEVILVNTPPRDRCDEGRRECFEVKGSFRVHCEVREIEVKIAGECKRVSVCQVGKIG